MSFFEVQPFARQIELDGGAGLNRNMDADLAVLRPKPRIGVLANQRVWREAQQPHGFQWALEYGQDVAKIGTAAKQGGIRKRGRIGRVRSQVARRSGKRA